MGCVSALLLKFPVPIFAIELNFEETNYPKGHRQGVGRVHLHGFQGVEEQ